MQIWPNKLCSKRTILPLFAFFAMDREPILFSHFQDIVIQVSESLSFWDIITL